jgi:hypothetical protein
MQEKPATQGSKVELPRVLGSVSKELAIAAEHCDALQALTSSLLEKTNHPDLAAEFRMLQDLDRLQQTLAELAKITKFLSASISMSSMDSHVFEEVIGLRSLRDRLLNGTSGQCHSVFQVETDTDWL